MGRKAGLTDAKLSAVLGNDMTSFTEPERLAIELSDALTSTPANVSDDLYTKLRSQFSEEQLLELSAQFRLRIIGPGSTGCTTRRATDSIGRRIESRVIGIGPKALQSCTAPC